MATYRREVRWCASGAVRDAARNTSRKQVGKVWALSLRDYYLDTNTRFRGNSASGYVQLEASEKYSRVHGASVPLKLE